MHQILPRRGLATSPSWILFPFLLCSLLGRFGVAFLGFAFNLDDTVYHIDPLTQPDWVNGSLDAAPMLLAVDGQNIGQLSFALVHVSED